MSKDRQLGFTQKSRLDRPIFVIGAPRSGTTLLFRSLSCHMDVWHLETESHYILEGPMHPKYVDYDSNRVVTLDESSTEYIKESFFKEALNLNPVVKDPLKVLEGNTILSRLVGRLQMKLAKRQSRTLKGETIRFLEKTPKNTLRIPFIREAFPDALFIFLTRSPYDNIRSILNGWESFDQIGPFKVDRFNRYGYDVMNQLNLEDFNGERWKFALVPEWNSRGFRSIQEVAAFQYYQCNFYANQDLKECKHVYKVKLEDFLADTKEVMHDILVFCDLNPSDTTVAKFIDKMPKVNTSKVVVDQDEMILMGRARAIPGFESLVRELGYEC